MSKLSTTVTVKARVLGRKQQNLEARQLVLEGLPKGPTLGQVIEKVVMAEVAAFHTRQAEQRLVRFLTQGEMADAAAAGKVSSGGYIDDDHAKAGTQAVDVRAAVDTALLAHMDGLFQVVVDGSPAGDQDQILEIHDGSTLMFLRLVALAGG